MPKEFVHDTPAATVRLIESLGDWKTHKTLCKAAHQMAELLRIGVKATMYEESLEQQLDILWMGGATGEDLHNREPGLGLFWHLDAAARMSWEKKAKDLNLSSRIFLTGYFAPISPLWSPDSSFRLASGAEILFSHGKPTADLITQLISRCTTWTARYDELNTLLGYVACPIQQYAADLAGTSILDLALSMVLLVAAWAIPAGRILDIAQTSPSACAHLLPAVALICRGEQVSAPIDKLLDIFEAFKVRFRNRTARKLSVWLFLTSLHDFVNLQQMEERVLKDEDELPLNEIEARDHTADAYLTLLEGAVARLGAAAVWVRTEWRIDFAQVARCNVRRWEG
ncbi:hypothetical protein DFH09DRAFT_1075808 [Mycena vulgaris]|nr:hypothetical protein DFH09DRAFT_1075808 [Mycena vulgaris]